VPKPFIVYGQGIILGQVEAELKALLKNLGFQLLDYFRTFSIPTDDLNVGM
jgi:thiamine pyrophosphate-dependent acetolactate synthase large subunit-like protein